MADQDTNVIFKLLPITSYKRECSLCSHLVHALHPQPPMFSDDGTYSCIHRQCNACKFVVNYSVTHIKGPNGSFNVSEAFTCISMNIVYGICKRRHIIYIGETDCQLADRISEHIRSIQSNFCSLPPWSLLHAAH